MAVQGQSIAAALGFIVLRAARPGAAGSVELKTHAMGRTRLCQRGSLSVYALALLVIGKLIHMFDSGMAA